MGLSEGNEKCVHCTNCGLVCSFEVISAISSTNLRLINWITFPLSSMQTIFSGLSSRKSITVLIYRPLSVSLLLTISDGQMLAVDHLIISYYWTLKCRSSAQMDDTRLSGFSTADSKLPHTVMFFYIIPSFFFLAILSTVYSMVLKCTSYVLLYIHYLCCRKQKHNGKWTAFI